MATFLSTVEVPSSHVLGESELVPSFATSTHPATVTDYPKLTLFLFAVGGFTVARFALKTLFVLLQTFLVSGKSVRVQTYVTLPLLTTSNTHSSRSMVLERARGLVSCILLVGGTIADAQ